MGLNPDFWRENTVLVTGHTGFKGSWLTLWLTLLRARVIGYSLPPPTNPSLFESARVHEGITSITGDVRDFEKLLSVIREHRPTIVMHLAAQSLVRRSYEDPVGTFSTNVMGTVNVLEACRRSRSVAAVLVVTSDKCYENNEWPWPYRENDRLGGHDPYSSSKACAELVTSAYTRSFFSARSEPSTVVNIATARAGNVLGGGDWAEDRLVPDIMRAWMDNRPVRIRNPHALRPWQHVLDPLRGYLMLIERLTTDGDRFAGPWNFAPESGDIRPVSWVVEHVAQSWGDSAGWEADPTPQPHEAGVLRLDATRAGTLLGWSPALSLADTLEWTARWYRDYHSGKDPKELTIRDITRFGDLCP